MTQSSFLNRSAAQLARETAAEAAQDTVADHFWPGFLNAGAGLTPRHTIDRLSRLLDDAGAPERSPDDGAALPEHAPRSGARPPCREVREHGGPFAGEAPRPAARVDMDEEGGSVVVRRVSDGVLLGVFNAVPRDGAGMCFTPLRSPRELRELRDDGIIT